MVREYRTEKAGKLKHPKSYIRQNQGTEDEMRALGQSYLRRPLYPLIVRKDFEVADGNRRLDAILMIAGPSADVPICVTDDLVTDDVMVEVMIESAAHTRALSPYEEFLGGKKWLELHPGATADQLAQKINLSPAMLCRTLSLSRCIPAVVEAAAKEQIGPTEWYAISKATSPEEQMALLDLKLKGCTRDQLESAIRRGRKGHSGEQAEERVTRASLFLPGGSSLTIAGREAVTLTAIIDSLTYALQEAKAAEKKGDGARSLIVSLQERHKPKKTAAK